MIGLISRVVFIVGIAIFFHTIYKELCGLVDPLVVEPCSKEQPLYLNGGSIEQVSFQSINDPEKKDTIMRSGVLVKRPQSRGVVLICHGYMCNAMDVGIFRLMFPNFDVMTFDFRAHGDHVDDRQTCTFGKDEAQDVYAAVSYVRSRVDLGLDKKPLIGYGFSMGAVALIQAQAQYKNLFDLLILDCPYDHSENVIKRCMENLKFSLFGYEFSLPGRSLLEKYAFHPFVQSVLKTLLKTVAHLDATATKTCIFPVSPADSMKQITIPCLLIHCVNDEKVPVQAAKNLFANAQGYIELIITPGRRHFDSFFCEPEKYAWDVNQFIENFLSHKFVNKKQAIIHENGIMQRSV